MKNFIRKRLLWIIPVVTTVFSLVYIGTALQEKAVTASEKNVNSSQVAVAHLSALKK